MLVGCFHGDDDHHPRPCPPMCPVQQWHISLFKRRWRRWVLRDRRVLDRHLQERRVFRAYADQFPDGRWHGVGKPRQYDEILASARQAFDPTSLG